MSKNIRLYDYIDIDISTAQKLFLPYDKNIIIDRLELIEEGLSTSNYIVYIKNSRNKFLLKIYPKNGGNSEIEVSSYKNAQRYVNVPNINFFDNTKISYDRAYVIMEYIEGVTLKDYIIKYKKLPKTLVFNIASSLANLHNRLYENKGLLDKDLNVKEVLPPARTQYRKTLNSFAGNHINDQLKKDILDFITENEDMLEKLDSEYVYSHGDFYPSNILVDKNDNIWFIDFEYSLSSSRYLDIGKFFRDRIDLDKYITEDVYNNFFNGYNSSANLCLNDDWIKLAKLMDMLSMLGLINKQKVPNEWVKGIEEAIVKTMNIVGR